MSRIEHLSPATVSAEDIRRLGEVHEAAIRRLCAAHYSAEQMRAWTGGGDPEGFRKPVETSPCFIVARQEGMIAGFGSLRADGSIRHVYVHPDFGRRGVGGALLGELERQMVLRKFEKAVLDSSLNAVPFYRKNGYGEGARSVVRMGEQDIEVVKMEKVLPP